MPAYTYILTNNSRTLYIGMTDDLRRRLFEHKTRAFEDSFTARYHVDRLAYYEVPVDGPASLAREAQLKRWSRGKKIALVERVNPQWADLGDRWFTRDELETQTMVARAAAIPDLLLPSGSAGCTSPSAG